MDNWKDVKGYEGIYKVSDTGKIRSVERYVVGENGSGIYQKLIKGRILRRGINRTGYYKLQFSVKGVSKTVLAHRLVAMAFIPNPENKPEVNHIDGDKFNNNITNLEWVTRAEQMQHAYRTGLINANHLKKPVRISKGVEFYEFDSVGETAKYLKCSACSVGIVANGHSPSIFGWKAEYI